MNYKKEYSRILKNLEKWNKELKKLQETCPHEDISGHCNYSGSYYVDPEYWVRVHCEVCGMYKSFYASTNREEYGYWVDRVRNQNKNEVEVRK